MGEACTVMVVDDSADIRETLRDALTMLEYNVIEASNGREALDLLRRAGHTVELVLLDLMMPVLDGWQFLDARRADAELKKIPVVVVTASQSPALKDSDVTMLKKPVTFDDLQRVVEHYC